jgi:GNAT superfamily N-acetyltransferase
MLPWGRENRLRGREWGSIVGRMEIRALDVGDAKQSDTWYEALHEGAAAGRHAPLIVGRTALLTSLRTNDTNAAYDRRAFGAWDGTICLGTLLLDLPRRDNTDSAELDVNVPPAFRRRGVGGALLRHVLQLAASLGRTTITDEVNVPIGQTLERWPGGRFALSAGFVSVHTEERLMLDLPAEAPAHRLPDGYEVVSWLGVVPEQWWDSFAEMNTLMERDVPSGELDREPVVHNGQELAASQERLVRQGYGLVTTLVLGADRAPVAYTRMMVTGEDGVHVLQDDTFVLRAHRGHGLGTVAKAANLRQLGQHYPRARHVHTWTAEVNDAMRVVNERFGFRAVETMHAVQLTLGSDSL